MNSARPNRGVDQFRLVRMVGGRSSRGGYALVFVCYLDDSDAELSSVVTMAGYLAPLDFWERYEVAAAEIYARYEIDVLHAFELHGTKGQFKGWSRIKKQSFIDELRNASQGLVLGIGRSVRKKAYKQRQSETGLNKSMSAYGVAFATLGREPINGIPLGGVF